LYSVLSLLILGIAYYYSDYFINDKDAFNLFTYTGTVATIVAFLIAAGEVIHAIQTTKSIQEQSLKVLKEVKTIENASSFSDCISSIDAVNQSVFVEKYDSAITNFQHFRKLCVKVVPGFTVIDDEGGELNKLGVVELMLLKATKTHDTAPLSKAQKTSLLKGLLVIKQNIESLNPAKGAQDVTTKN